MVCKYVVFGLMKLVGLELVRDGIWVNCVVLGNIVMVMVNVVISGDFNDFVIVE